MAQPVVSVPGAAVVDVTRLLDEARWRPYHTWLVFLTALTIIFDGVDNQLLGIAIPTVMTEWSLPRAAFAPVVSLGYLGMMAGGALAGFAGDRIGRRAALLGSMVVFGAMTAAAAMTHSIAGLAALRLLAGIGLGGAMPNAAALAAEYVPRHRRPLAVTVTIVCVPLGATIAGLLGIRVLPVFGWRALFVVGGIVPIVGAALLMMAMPESPHFLSRRPTRWPDLVRLLRRMGHAVDAASEFVDGSGRMAVRAPASLLFRADFLRDTLALWGAFFSCLLAVYLGFSWLTSLLSGAGFTAGAASTGITAFNLGGVAGAILGAIVIARVGSRVAMLAMAAGAIAGALGLAGLRLDPASPMTLLVMLTLTGGLINAVQTTMYALATHVYPSEIRATGVGTAVAVGRAGAIVSGYAGAWALEFRGSVSYFLSMGAAMAACFVALALVRRHVAPRPRRVGRLSD
jgi:AAHS family 4-hydroxybenzoate transporter-like MFS transporter